jgi:solute carrier family 13 (sodium-dependent dicarboxylate transporter), member 2/3/5
MKLVASLAAGLAAWLALQGFSPDQARVGAVFVFTVVLWITEALPLAVSALLSTTLLVVVAGIDEKAAYAAYGNPIIPLFIGSFIMAKAMEVTGLSSRAAYWILSQKWASRSPGAILASLGGVSCFISLFVSNTATTAMLLPIGLSILSSMGLQNTRSRFAIGVMLMLTWGSSVAVGLPIGTPPNLLGIASVRQFAEVDLSFLQWAAFAMPVTLLMMAGSWTLLNFMFRESRDPGSEAAGLARARLAALGAMTAKEKWVLVSFGLALLLWTAPDIIEIVAGKASPVVGWLDKGMTEAAAAIIGASLLFMFPYGDKGARHVLSWKEAATIDWGVILLFGGGIALGDAMFKSGLAKSLGEAAATGSGVSGVWGVTALMIAAAIILSELASNTAAATTLLPLAAGLSEGVGASPVAPLLGVALGASMGFMLPVSTAPNAIVYSSGLVPGKEMLKAGFFIDILGFFVIFACLRLILPLLGLA